MKTRSRAFAIAGNERITVATWVTLVRLCLVPVITWAVWFACWRLAGFVFLFAAATDFLDGYLARAYNEKTVLGAMLDAVADKLLMTSVLVTVLLMPAPVVLPHWALLVVLIKELVIMGGAVLLIGFRGMRSIAPPFLAKMSMAGEMLLLAWILLACSYGFVVPVVLAVVVVILALASCVVYVGRLVQRWYQIG